MRRLYAARARAAMRDLVVARVPWVVMGTGLMVGRRGPSSCFSEMFIIAAFGGVVGVGECTGV